jgi:hypothetical protein
LFIEKGEDDSEYFKGIEDERICFFFKGTVFVDSLVEKVKLLSWKWFIVKNSSNSGSSMDSRRQEFLREDGRHSGVRRGCGVNRCTARWLVGTWHHHHFKGKVEIVGYCLENDAIAGN